MEQLSAIFMIFCEKNEGETCKYEQDAAKPWLSLLHVASNGAGSPFFCYLVNLLQYFETYPDAEDCRTQLKRYHFFDDLMRVKDERYKEVMNSLCVRLYMDAGKLLNLKYFSGVGKTEFAKVVWIKFERSGWLINKK